MFLQVFLFNPIADTSNLTERNSSVLEFQLLSQELSITREAKTSRFTQIDFFQTK